jgi:hypothetical protein
MKKLIAFLFACGFAVAVVSCGQKAETSESSTADTATVAEPVPVDTVADSAAVVPSDTTGK